MSTILQRRIYDMRGIVQGVGFRPALSRLASSAHLSGWVQNLSDRVRLQIEGEAQILDRFITNLNSTIPASASITDIQLLSMKEIECFELADKFIILPSATGGAQEVVIPADLAMCSDCECELLDPKDRRYGYPFTTCTACGPRYTVVNSMPYDRERTTLSKFPLCEQCQKEYEDSHNRRFHAESIACPTCGPRIWLEGGGGDEIEGDPIQTARATLQSGGIVALRGIGGFLLVTDPRNEKALKRLRQRKKRPHKPFALMARSLDALTRKVKLCEQTKKLLSSPISPIVIAELTGDSGLDIELINPDNNTIGVMIPTTPLHKLLFEPIRNDPTPPFEFLVMTSGNRGGEPICISNQEARERLDGIADIYIMHDREINLRCDDSIFAIQNGREQAWRRARGCAPDALTLSKKLSRSVLAMGAELRNTITVAYDNKLVPSPHIGDLDTPEAVCSLERTVKELPEFLDISPDAIAVDMHPDMNSTRIGRRVAEEMGIPLIEVQHHHAHAIACLSEHGRNEGLALVMDGTGLGDDGLIWGAELLDVSPDGYRRLASFKPVPLPGGDAATSRPPRQLVARLLHYGLTIEQQKLRSWGIEESEPDIWRQQIDADFNTPYTSACGRLFDSWSALLGLCVGETSYDAQAAIRLEAAAARAQSGPTPPELALDYKEEDGMLTIDWAPAFAMALDHSIKSEDIDLWALAFHRAVTDASLRMIEYGVALSGREQIALSGGVMMNRLLTRMLSEQLSEMKLSALIHRNVPPNDGGISIGQAVIAGTMFQASDNRLE